MAKTKKEKALEVKIATAEERLRQLKEEKAKEVARKRVMEASDKKKSDVRKKLLVGSMLLDEFEKDDALKEKVWSLLNVHLTKEADRCLFHLASKDD